MGDQKKEGLDVPRKDRRKIICCANNTIDEVTKSLLVNWNYTELRENSKINLKVKSFMRTERHDIFNSTDI